LILHRFCMWLILQNVIAFLPYAYVIPEGNVRSHLDGMLTRDFSALVEILIRALLLVVVTRSDTDRLFLLFVLPVCD